MYCIKCFDKGTKPHVTYDYSVLARGIIVDQYMMGWTHFLQGKLIKNWITKFNVVRKMQGGKEDDILMINVARAITTFTTNIWVSWCAHIYRGTKDN